MGKRFSATSRQVAVALVSFMFVDFRSRRPAPCLLCPPAVHLPTSSDLTSVVYDGSVPVCTAALPSVVLRIRSWSCFSHRYPMARIPSPTGSFLPGPLGGDSGLFPAASPGFLMVVGYLWRFLFKRVPLLCQLPRLRWIGSGTRNFFERGLQGLRLGAARLPFLVRLCQPSAFLFPRLKIDTSPHACTRRRRVHKPGRAAARPCPHGREFGRSLVGPDAPRMP